MRAIARVAAGMFAVAVLASLVYAAQRAAPSPAELPAAAEVRARDLLPSTKADAGAGARSVRDRSKPTPNKRP